MQISTSSLRALPPKQALALLMAEKARRVRNKRANRPRVRRSATDFDGLEAEQPPQDVHGVPYLLLDRELPFSDLYHRKARHNLQCRRRGSGKSWALADALLP